MIKLEELLQAVQVLDAILEQSAITISGVAYHSGKVTPGQLFVCVRGYQTDGHQYLEKAVHNGATAAIVEQFQAHIPIPQYRVSNSRIALARLAAAFYHHPADKLDMIGITASNGKTTTSYMVNAMLENHGLKTGLIGTVSIKIDDTEIPSQLTTPESLDLQHYLKQMVDRGVTHTTMEVSSSALETHRVEGIVYDIVSLNNISREHIDTHGSFERYWQVKSSLIRQASANSYAVLNLDDPYAASLINETAAQVITFGWKNNAGHLHCKNLDLSTGRAKYTVEILKPFSVKGITYAEGEFEIELSVPGLHSVYNSLVAITIALLCGISVSTIQHTLRTFSGVERRFDFIYEDDFTIIDDHFANPGNIDVTLETLKFMNFGKLHLVYGIRGSRGPTVNRENAEAIARWAAKLDMNEIIATKSVSHVTAKDYVTDEEVAVFMDEMAKAKIDVRLYDELPDAISDALSQAVAGDLILLGGCQGMDPAARIVFEQLRQNGKNKMG